MWRYYFIRYYVNFVVVRALVLFVCFLRLSLSGRWMGTWIGYVLCLLYCYCFSCYQNTFTLTFRWAFTNCAWPNRTIEYRWNVLVFQIVDVFMNSFCIGEGTGSRLRLFSVQRMENKRNQHMTLSNKKLEPKREEEFFGLRPFVFDLNLNFKIMANLANWM